MKMSTRTINFLAMAMASATLLPTVFGIGYSDTFEIVQDGNGCITMIRDFNPLIHKSMYKVGVYANQGDAKAYELYDKTFATYLTATAGQKFDPPIQFEIVPVNLNSLMVKAEAEQVDFFFATPAVFSCMATEYEAQGLVTIINKREARGHEYELDVYGGVMFVMADNDRVNAIDDFKGKTIGAGGITMMGGAQTQFYEMFREGLSFVADPAQVVFTNDERKTVQGVIDGDYEIGFARTDQIERHILPNGEPVDPEIFKVINPQIHVLDNGELFPFVSSTGLNGEWPVAALDHVSRDVSKEVQEALLALRDHATSLEINETLRCDTTPELAELALSASKAGLMVGFRTSRSYYDVRTKQEAAGFLQKNQKGQLECIKGETLYHDIYCPPEHYKLTEEEFDRSCEIAGIPCKEGYTCYCQPCIKAFEVDVFQYFPDDADNSTAILAEQADALACDKMSLCGEVEQTKNIHLRIIDNRKRENPEVSVLMHLETRTVNLDPTPVKGKPHQYDITWSSHRTGMGILEVYFNDVQIPQSPVRIQVVDRQCDLDYPGQRRTNTDSGDCRCSEGTMEIRGKCVESTVMAIVISLAAVLFVGMLGFWYISYRNKKQDELWQISVDELQFDDPVEVIGQGSFGVVLLGRYRGTTVALKRAIKVPKQGSKHKRKSSKGGSSRGSRTKASSNMDSVGLSSGGVSSNDSEDPERGEIDQEAVSHGSSSQGNSNHGSSRQSSGHSHNNSGRNSQSRQGTNNSRSLGFLAQDFGPRSKWAWLFPWMKKDDYHSRFKDAILGTNGSSASTTKTWHAYFCPWFNAQVRAEEEFISEMRVLSRLRHPCITTVLGAVISRSHDPMLVMEYMEYGSLHDLLRNETMYLSGEIILQIARDLAQGLRFLHSSKPPILHGDMKARNILVDSRFRAKLCDFGLSAKKTNLISGTPYWLAPEYLRGQSGYTTMCDIYSVGIILFEIYSREDPYKNEDFRETLRKVCDRRVNKRPNIPSNTPPKMAEMMKKCWSPDPMFRPQAKDLDTAFLDWNMRDAEPLAAADQQQMVRERPTGDMLYELFPKHIADQLKAGQKVEPEQHEEVTVVFSDIVHFTDISRALSALKVSQMLDRLYLAFDKVARKNNVFKVETIGDAYMGVTNLEKKQMDTHAKEAALFAIDLVNEASKILIDDEDPSKGYVNIRVGFHSGAVVSNVIGSLNPRYGLFGDTVNTSSRMESNSKANRILCSEASYKILQEQAPEISIRKRGRIAVKGKGDMIVYWVGDEEIKAGVSPNKIDVFEGKKVGFHDEVKEDDGEEGEEEVEAVDEHIWRKELRGKLTEMEDHEDKPASKKASKKDMPEQAPAKKFPEQKTGKKHVKEVLHMKRSFD